MAGAHGGEGKGQEEEHNRQKGHVTADRFNRILGYLFQGPIGLGDGKEIGDPGQHDEQAGGITLNNIRKLDPPKIVAHDQG